MEITNAVKLERGGIYVVTTEHPLSPNSYRALCEHLKRIGDPLDIAFIVLDRGMTVQQVKQFQCHQVSGGAPSA